MDTEIEILEMHAATVDAVFYYDVDPTDRLPAAADNARNPKGTRLTGPQRAALKAGTLIEHSYQLRSSGMDLPEIEVALVAEYADEEDKARRGYSTRYNGRSRAYDGSNWS